MTSDGVYEGICKYDNSGNEFIGTTNCVGSTITIEFIPDYSDKLCYDGKSYVISYGLPILKDYTIIADRDWFKRTGLFMNKGSLSTTINSAFCFENIPNDDSIVRTSSYGSWNDVDIPDSGISYQSRSSYNGKDIKVGNDKDNTDILTIGSNTLNQQGCWTGCHGDVLIFDCTLTDSEINSIKNSIMNDALIINDHE